METKHKAKWMVTATSPNKQLSVDARIRSVVSVTSAACLCCYKSGKKTTLKSSHSVMMTASSLQLLSFYWLNQRSCDCTHFLCMCLPAHPWRVVYEVIAPGSPPPPIFSFVVVSQFSSSFWHSIQETGSTPFGCRLLALIQHWEPQVLPYWPDPVRCRPQVSVRACSYTLKSWCALLTGGF